MSRVLVVEDSPTQAEAIRLLLRGAGFDTDGAADGLEALAAIRRRRPDLIVTDLLMPRMDGLALVAAVRADAPAVPIVLITEHGSEEIAFQALRGGAASYVPKRNLDQLPAVVAEIVAIAEVPDHHRLLGHLETAEFRFTLENDLTTVDPVIRCIESVVEPLGLCDRAESIRLAVAVREAIVNAIDHGNLELNSDLRQDDERVYRRLGDERRGLPPYRDRRVRIDFAVSREQARVTIADEGPGFSAASLPRADDPSSLSRIGGRGLQLIRAFMDEVRYNERGNVVTLVKRRRPEGAPRGPDRWAPA